MKYNQSKDEHYFFNPSCGILCPKLMSNPTLANLHWIRPQLWTQNYTGRNREIMFTFSLIVLHQLSNVIKRSGWYFLSISVLNKCHYKCQWRNWRGIQATKRYPERSLRPFANSSICYGVGERWCILKITSKPSKSAFGRITGCRIPDPKRCWRDPHG